MVPAMAPPTTPFCFSGGIDVYHAQPDNVAAIAHKAPSFLTHPVISTILLPSSDRVRPAVKLRFGGRRLAARCLLEGQLPE